MSTDMFALVELADQRVLPTLPERTWYVRTGQNPVADAVAYVRRWKKTANFEVAMAIVAILMLTACVLPAIAFFTSPGPVEGLRASYMMGAIAFFLAALIAAFDWYGARLKRFLHDRDERLHTAKLFCKEYFELECWAPGGPGSVRGKSDEELKLVADAILVKAADDVLDLQEQERTMERELKRSELIRVFNVRYEALSRHGLTGGGYDSYFAQARHAREERRTA